MFQNNARFLVVDDSNMIRDLIRTALSQMGLKNCDSAADGAAALEKIKAAIDDGQPYSLVFTDINMPRIDGLLLLETLRSNLKTRETPIIIVTTESSKQSVVRAVMQGVAGYMVKPFGVDDVKKRVQDIYDRLHAPSSGHSN